MYTAFKIVLPESISSQDYDRLAPESCLAQIKKGQFLHLDDFRCKTQAEVEESLGKMQASSGAIQITCVIVKCEPGGVKGVFRIQELTDNLNNQTIPLDKPLIFAWGNLPRVEGATEARDRFIGGPSAKTKSKKEMSAGEVVDRKEDEGATNSYAPG